MTIDDDDFGVQVEAGFLAVADLVALIASVVVLAGVAIRALRGGTF